MGQWAEIHSAVQGIGRRRLGRYVFLALRYARNGRHNTHNGQIDDVRQDRMAVSASADAIRIGPMSSASHRDSTRTSGNKEIRFRHWPLREEPLRSFVMLIIAAGAAVLVARAAGNVWAGVAAWIALAICLWRMWLPVEFEFGPRGVLQRYLGRQRRVAWRDIARCEFQRRGLLLHATDDATALGTMRSIYVRYPAERERLRELIELELARWSARSPSTFIETTKRNASPPENDGSAPAD